MKKAFTLIELLVVIAIIAILAAILFPVFAQAKVAAKKATSISNQKQIATGIKIYMADHDDFFPRNDDCQPGSSLNPANNAAPFNPTGAGCTGAGPYNYRMNHYSWQKWIMPYVKNVDMFWNPAFGKVDPTNSAGTLRQWTDNGQIFHSYALNTSVTGQLDTYNRAPGMPRRFRNSWTGGSDTNLQDVAATMLVMEMVNADINFIPGFLDGSGGTTAETMTMYPPAIRELWIPVFKTRVGTSGCTYNNITDQTKAPFSGNIVLGYADGHAKAISVDKFLSNTPLASQYTVSSRWSCLPNGGSWTISAAPVYQNGQWPMWGL